MPKYKSSKKTPSYIKQSELTGEASVHDEKYANKCKFSFQYFDDSQEHASSFLDWQKMGTLVEALETLRGFCKSTLSEQLKTKKFKTYGSFPDKDKTKFFHPKHVPQDACWGRLHVNGDKIMAGHIVNDTFYIVFFDSNHNFYLTKKHVAIKKVRDMAVHV